MKKIKELLDDNFQGVLLTVGIAMANLVFFQQESWKMDPVKIALLSLGFFFLLRIFTGQMRNIRDIREKTGIILLGLLFGFMIVVGQKIQVGTRIFQSFSLSDLIWILFYTWTGILLFTGLNWLCSKRKIAGWPVVSENIKRNFKRKRWLLYAGILAVCWIPIWIVYFPGIVPDDATISIAMVLGDMPWDNHFPVFYSLIVGLCLKIGNLFLDYNAGIALYSFLQLGSMALILGRMLEWMRSKGVHKILVYFGLAFFGAAPFFGNYAIVMWKDPWFCGVMLLLGMFLYDHVVEDRNSFLQKKNLGIYSGMSILMSLLRNNGVYIVILTSLCLVAIYRKEIKKIAAVSVCTVALIYFVTGPVYMAVFSAENLFVESVGIPLQQMARVVEENGKIGEEEEEFLDSLMPMEKYLEYYNPYLVDPIKWAPEFNTDYLNTHKGEFFKTWFSLLKSNFGIYVEQYLMGTYGFWHIGGDQPYEFVKTEIVGNDWGIYQNQFLENHLGYFIQEELGNKYDFLPSGLFVWLLLYDIVLCWMKRRSIYILPLTGMIGNWLTLMIATPTAFGIRYIYILVIAFPLLLVYPRIALKQQEKERNT